MKGLTLIFASFGALAVVYLFFAIYLATHNSIFVVGEFAALFVQLTLLITGAIIGLRELRRPPR